jgi:integrase
LLQNLLKLEIIVIKSYNQRSLVSIDKQWLVGLLEKNNAIIAHHSNKNKIVAYFDVFIKYRKNEIRKSTLKRYVSVKNMLNNYQNKEKITLFFSDTTHNFKLNFIEYCLKEKYAKSTINRSLSMLKTVCAFALKNEIRVNLQFKDWKINFADERGLKKPIYLNFNELKKIENLKLKKPHLINARDWLVISCYVGQRFSDFIKFTNNMIYYENNKPYIEFTQQKTNKKMTIPIHKKVLEILEKRNHSFPNKVSLRYYNGSLKTLCKMANINVPTYGIKKEGINGKFEEGFYKKYELISSHVGRRSFATIFYGTIPTSLLKSTTGHSTERMFLVYIGKSNSEQAKQLHKYF